MSETRGHVPVYISNIVSRQIFANFRKLDPLALEGALVLARKKIVCKAPGLEMELLNLMQDLLGNHQGTSILSSRVWIRSSLVFPSASAS